jgi:hypothetical protein
MGVAAPRFAPVMSKANAAKWRITNPIDGSQRSACPRFSGHFFGHVLIKHGNEKGVL